MNGVDARLRPMRWWHLPEVVALEQHIFGATAWSPEQFYAELAATDRWVRVLVAKSDRGAAGAGSRVLGYVDVALQGRDADLMTIAVAPDKRGRGFGAILLAEAMRASAARGAHHMFLEVAADNPARQWYLQQGFATIDRRAGYYGDGSDALIMRAVLGPGPAAEGGIHA